MYFVLAILVGILGANPAMTFPVAQIQGSSASSSGAGSQGFGIGGQGFFTGFPGPGFQGTGFPGAGFPFFQPQTGTGNGMGFPQFVGFSQMGSFNFGAPQGPGGIFSTSESQSFSSSGSFNSGQSAASAGSTAGASSQSAGHQQQQPKQPEEGFIDSANSGSANTEQYPTQDYIDTSSGTGSTSQGQSNNGSHGGQSSSSAGSQSHSAGGHGQKGAAGSASGAQSTGSSFGPDGRNTELNFGNGPGANFGVRINTDESADGTNKKTEISAWVWNN